MKSRKEKPFMDGVEFDSREEVEFWKWTREAVEHGFMAGADYHPTPLLLSEKAVIGGAKQLKTKTKYVERCLFREHSYQPDFIIQCYDKFDMLPHGLLRPFKYEEAYGHTLRSFYIDIKGGFEPTRSKEQVFSINQKWVYAKFGIYINKVVPKEFFAKTWAPSLRNKRTGWKLEKYSACRSVEDVDKEPVNLEFN